MNNKIENIINILISFALAFLGILFFTKYSFLWSFIHIIVVIIFIAYALQQLYQCFKQEGKKIIPLVLNALVLLGFALFISQNKNLFFAFTQYVFGFWILINSIILFINYFFVYLKDKIPYRTLVLIQAIITLVFALLLITEPLNYFFALSYVIGAYLIFLAISHLIKTTERLLHSTKHNVSIPMPVFIGAFVPQRALTLFNKLFKENQLQPTEIANTNPSVDLEVFIYLKESGPEAFGHVDICYRNKIYSYGCHDPHNRRLFGSLGDGVLIVSDRNKFIANAVTNSKSTVVQYGVSLTTEQIEIVEKRIDSLMQRATPFKSDAQIQLEDNQSENIANDYLSRVYKATEALSYKFSEGKFKTYFVFTTNCVQLADYILRTKDLELFYLNGIITPGTYYEFLEREYNRKNSIVIERSVYLAK